MSTRFDPAALTARICTTGDRPTRKSTAPFDGSLIGEVPVCDAGDVVAAVTRARNAQAAWRERPLDERASVLLRYHDLVLDRQADLLDLVQLETGKARVSAYEEAIDVALTARYYGNAGPAMLRPQRRRGAMPLLTHTTEAHVPKGVVGVISPWNYPLTLAVSDALPALLAGNGVVLKPDSQTPFTALAAIELLVEAGIPAELVQVVTGPGPDIGPVLIDHVDFLMFTGSTATGRVVAEQCGRRLIGFSGELGGKNAMLVLADADLKRTVEGAMWACFSNSGQLCISIERLYVEDAVYDRFVPAFVERVQRMRLAAGIGWHADMGSLVSEKQLATVRAHVDDAVAKGATVLTGGNARPDLGPLFYEPTVLEGVRDDMTLACEETFGPVVAVQRVADAEEAVGRANDSAYGLNASVWASSARGTEVAARLRAGTVNVNEGYAATWGSHDAPMGGMHDSGLGRRHGREGLLKYTEAQTIAVQRVLPIGPWRQVSFRTYARVLNALLRVMRRLPFVK